MYMSENHTHTHPHRYIYIYIYIYIYTHKHIFHTPLQLVLWKCITIHLRFLFQTRCGNARRGCIFWTLGYSHRWYWGWACGMLRCRGALSSTTSAPTCWVAINISVHAAYPRRVTQRSLWHTQPSAEVRTFQA
jgi:hypothetical protein